LSRCQRYASAWNIYFCEDSCCCGALSALCGANHLGIPLKNDVDKRAAFEAMSQSTQHIVSPE